MKSTLRTAAFAFAVLAGPGLADPAPAPAQASFSVQTTPIAEILKNPTARAVLDKEIPALRRFYGRIGDMTVAQIAQASHGVVGGAKLKAIQAGFNGVR